MINEGKVGVSRLQGGADIRIRMFDTEGRRGMMYVRGNAYAVSVVDLPTITEGLKSWDKKNWIKSVDVCQLMLVLGRCTSEEQAREYPLPTDVNPKNYQYAHGLTPPMHFVRKRRFEKTSRARLDDIERIERKLNHILAQDRMAKEVKWRVLDHDPREDRETTPESQDDSDAEGEMDVDEQSYFPENQYTNEEATAIEALLEMDDDVPSTAVPSTAPASALPSDSMEPSESSAPTPAAAESSAAEAEDADADDDDNDASSGDDDGVEGGHSEERLQKLERIKDLETKIKQKREQLKTFTNKIMKTKTARAIQDLENDRAMLMRSIGMGNEGGDKSEEE
ncbi:hypothetical protein BT93_L1100 [Corymbia citriodora subsp. variegata]|uniref:TAFII55 protein conserved region domain-containing protein n=1 Tax=Corymbia citriodora subsp. variegata TaxID=360336 RepID=A0A8T0CEI6_CORYI|nr:hypothetical protein BT93_L1100 [Corymbia citriodora subsp. variegata]